MKSHRLGILFAGALLFAATACTPPQEKIKRVFEAEIAKCKKAKGEWAEVTFLKTSKTMVLKEACSLELGKVEMPDQFHGHAMMGPYTWASGEDDELDVWVLTNVEWLELERARRVQAEKDPTKDTLQKAIADFDAAVKGMPNSWWIQRHRLENVLKLRAKTRKGNDPDVSIGPVAQKVFDETLTWAKAQNNPSYVAGTQLRVIDHLRAYANKLDIAMESMGSGDDVLERLIAEAKKTKNKVDEANYTKELEERRAQRVKDQEFLTKKSASLKTLLCAEIAKVSATGISDEEVSKKVVATKAAVKCS